MTEPNKRSPTEVEAVCRERKAFADGMTRMHGEICTQPDRVWTVAAIEALALDAFPLPPDGECA